MSLTIVGCERVSGKKQRETRYWPNLGRFRLSFAGATLTWRLASSAKWSPSGRLRSTSLTWPCRATRPCSTAWIVSWKRRSWRETISTSAGVVDANRTPLVASDSLPYPPCSTYRSEHSTKLTILLGDFLCCMPLVVKRLNISGILKIKTDTRGIFYPFDMDGFGVTNNVWDRLCN